MNTRRLAVAPHPLILVVLALSLVGFIPTLATAATTITVTTTADELTTNGTCSLREAIVAANTDTGVDACPAGSGADTITLPVGIYTLTIIGHGEDATLTGDLDITAGLTLTGAGAATTIIDGPLFDRVIHVLALTDVAIANVTIRGGSPRHDDAGGIYNSGGTLTLTGSTVSGNSADNGGGIYNSGALMLIDSTVSGNSANASGGIYNSGTLTLTDSTVSGNSANASGGIYNSGGTLTLTGSTVSGNTTTSAGGGIWNLGGTATLSNSTVSGNSANGGGGIHNSGGTLTLTDSTVRDNTADIGGGIFNSDGGTATLSNSTVSGNTAGAAGGISNLGGTLMLSNSTVSGNSAGISSGGGILNFATATLSNSTVSGNTAVLSGGGISNQGMLMLNNSTVSGNTASGGLGGGIRNFATATLSNTILAENTDTGGQTSDCFGTLTSAGYNLIGDPDGCTITGDTTGNIVGVDPLLGPLATNGGPTQTHALLPGSPAIDAGSPAALGSGAPACAATDQRGVRRPQDGDDVGDARCDIGAFERRRYEEDETSETTTLSVPLTGAGDADGSGQATLKLNSSLGTLCFDLTVANIVLPATAAELQAGSGPTAVVKLLAPDARGKSSGCVRPAVSLLRTIEQQPGSFSLTVRTSEYPTGALKGSLPGGAGSASHVLLLPLVRR